MGECRETASSNRRVVGNQKQGRTRLDQNEKEPESLTCSEAIVPLQSISRERALCKLLSSFVVSGWLNGGRQNGSARKEAPRVCPRSQISMGVTLLKVSDKLGSMVGADNLPITVRGLQSLLPWQAH
jgi:hypothetical protein